MTLGEEYLTSKCNTPDPPLLLIRAKDVVCSLIDSDHMGPRGQSYTPNANSDSYFILTSHRHQYPEHCVTVLIPRERTIGIRLSADEYSALERFSLETGARSMSDVARAAICKFIRKPVRESLASAAEHARQVRDLEQSVSQLNAEIALLNTRENA
jgi:hypothetical protein